MENAQGLPMNADSYYEIGHSHKVCEDYALSGVSADIAYAIVSDGCSASKESDVGARLLAHISRDAILYLQRRKLLYDFNFLSDSFKTTFEEIIMKKCLEVKDTLRLTYDIFDATLLVALGVGEAWKVLFAWGDGYFILRRPSDAIDVISMSYDSGAPYYLSYELSQDKKEAYSEQFGCALFRKSIERIMIKEKAHIIVSQEESNNPMRRSYYAALGEGATVQQIIVSSDGIGTYEDSLKSEGHINYEVHEILPEIVAYKNPVGEFVTRRMNRLKKDLSDRGIIHQDDVSCSAINFT